MFPNLDECGQVYADKIVMNVITKLKLVLNIEENDSAHWQLQKFFIEKFKRPETPEYGGHNMPDQSDLEMLSREVFGHM